VLSAQFVADLLKQAVMRGESQIGHLDGGGVTVATGGSGRDDENAALAASREEHTFPGGTINGVDHGIKGGLEDVLSIGFEKKRVQRVDVALGIDGLDTPRQDIDFGLAQFTLESMKLAIYIADADIIQIN
jgi:hypothetical protein